MVKLAVLLSGKDMIKSKVEKCISKLTQNFRQYTEVLQNAEVKASLSDLHNSYDFLLADKAANNKIITCKKFYKYSKIPHLRK